MSFLNKCEEYYKSRDFYEILGVTRDATAKEIKKAYHKLSLLVHPDRVDESEKLLATEKFKVLSKIHLVLHDAEKRSVYDESGQFDEEDGDDDTSWMTYWRNLFKPVTTEAIVKYEKEYIGSDTELRDIKKAYVNSKGDMDYMLEMIPFSNCDNEPRIIDVVRKMVDDGEVEEYRRFFHESARKKERRHRKWELEKEEVGEMSNELAAQIQKNQEERANNFMDMVNNLEAYYGNKNTTKRKAISCGKAKKPPVKRLTKKTKK